MGCAGRTRLSCRDWCGRSYLIVSLRNYRARNCESVRPRAPTSTTRVSLIAGASTRAVPLFAAAAPDVDSGAAGIALPTAIPLRRSLSSTKTFRSGLKPV